MLKPTMKTHFWVPKANADGPTVRNVSIVELLTAEHEAKRVGVCELLEGKKVGRRRHRRTAGRGGKRGRGRATDGSSGCLRGSGGSSGVRHEATDDNEPAHTECRVASEECGELSGCSHVVAVDDAARVALDRRERGGSGGEQLLQRWHGPRANTHFTCL